MDLHLGVVFKKGSPFGTADVIVRVEDNRPFHVMIDRNNHGISTSKIRTGLRFDWGNVLMNGDSLTILEVVGDPIANLNFTDLLYHIPLNTGGRYVDLSYQTAYFKARQTYYNLIMIKSKYIAVFQTLSRRAVFSSAEGRAIGIPARMLAYFCSKGQIERIGRGMYKIRHVDFDRDFEWEDLVLTALSIPNGIICLISALFYYELTDEIMREFWISVSHSTTSPVRENTHIVRMRNTSLGKTIIKIGNQKVKIFDRE